MATFMLNTIINNKEVIENLKSLPLNSMTGRKSLNLRKVMNNLQQELNNFEEAKNQYIRENGTEDGEGNITLTGEDNIQKANEFLIDMAQQEIEVNWEPVFDEDDLQTISSNTELKVSDLDFLEAVGLLEGEVADNE